MAITVDTQPGTPNELYGRELQFKVHSSIDGSVSLQSYGSSGGQLRLILNVSTSIFTADDPIEIVGTDIDGVYQVDTVVSSTIIDLTESYSGGSSGTLTGASVKIPNFKIKAEIEDGDGNTITTKYLYAISGYYYLNVEDVLKTEVDIRSVTAGTTGLTSDRISKIDYRAVFTEVYDSYGGGTEEGGTTNSDPLVVYAMSADYDHDVYLLGESTNKFLIVQDRPRICRTGEFQLHVNWTGKYRLKCVFNFDPVGTSNTVYLPSASTWYDLSSADGRGIVCIGHEQTTNSFDSYFNAYDNVTITAYGDGSPGDDFIASESKIFDIIDSCGITLMFKNWLGGYETYTFRGYESLTRVNRETYKSDGTRKDRNIRANRRYQLIGRAEADTSVIEALEQLITSNDVLLYQDDEWVNVNLITGELIKDTKDAYHAEIEIESQDLNIIK